MNLKDVIASIVYESVQTMQPADMYIGTVTNTTPLEVVLDSSQAAIKSEILYRTDAVIERKIPILKHKHVVPGTSTGSGGDPSHSHSISARETKDALEDYKLTVDGKVQEPVNGYIVITKGLAKGDKVLLMAVQGGQKYIILSHLN